MIVRTMAKTSISCLWFLGLTVGTRGWNPNLPKMIKLQDPAHQKELTVLTFSSPLVSSTVERDTNNNDPISFDDRTVANGLGLVDAESKVSNQEQEQGEWDHMPIFTGSDPHFLYSKEYYQRRSGLDIEAVVEYLVPIIAPIVAFLSYDIVASSFSTVIDLAANNKWVAVDGGSFQAKIITPTINGVVLPAISVLFATLASTTIRTLRDRQLDIRSAINAEAGELRSMEYLVAAFPDSDRQALCRQYMLQYTSRIIAECQPDWRHPIILAADGTLPSFKYGGIDSELNGVLQILTSSDDTMSVILQDQSFQAVTRLRQARQNRLTALQSTYPPLHYVILAVLASGTCTGFLMEADQELLFFMTAVQLKILWSMLVGTFAACFAVFYDLLNPFSGTYQVIEAVDQLYTIRQGLKASTRLSLLDYASRKDEECKVEESFYDGE